MIKVKIAEYAEKTIISFSNYGSCPLCGKETMKKAIWIEIPHDVTFEQLAKTLEEIIPKFKEKE